MTVGRRVLVIAVAAAVSGPVIVAGVQAGRRARPDPTLRVMFLNVGQGDASMIRTPSGRLMLIDAGRGDRDQSRGRTAVLPYLRRNGIHALDAIVLTHWDEDHAGGADAVLSGIRVGRLILPSLPRPREPAADTERETLAAARRARVTIWHLTRGQTIRTGDGVVLTVMNPPSRGFRYKRNLDNNGSLVLMVSFGNRRFLLTGDAEEEAEANVLRAGLDVKADVLKVGHHGSASGTSERWVRAVRPSWAVISVGRRNAFGHPSPVVLERLSRHRVRVFRTDRQGSVTMTTDGQDLRVDTNER